MAHDTLRSPTPLPTPQSCSAIFQRGAPEQGLQQAKISDRGLTLPGSRPRAPPSQRPPLEPQRSSARSCLRGHGAAGRRPGRAWWWTGRARARARGGVGRSAALSPWHACRLLWRLSWLWPRVESSCEHSSSRSTAAHVARVEGRAPRAWSTRCARSPAQRRPPRRWPWQHAGNLDFLNRMATSLTFVALLRASCSSARLTITSQRAHDDDHAAGWLWLRRAHLHRRAVRDQHDEYVATASNPWPELLLLPHRKRAEDAPV